MVPKTSALVVRAILFGLLFVGIFILVINIIEFAFRKWVWVLAILAILFIVRFYIKRKKKKEAIVIYGKPKRKI